MAKKTEVPRFKEQAMENREKTRTTHPIDEESKFKNKENAMEARSTTGSRKGRRNILKPINNNTKEYVDTGGTRTEHPKEVSDEIAMQYVQVRNN